MKTIRQPQSIKRDAFTLTELLVVIAIISILASLAAWGVFATIGNRRARNTEDTFKTVNKLLQSHWRYVIDEANKDSQVSPAVLALAGNDPARARVLWKKFRLMEAFPQTFAECNPATAFVYNNPSAANPYIPTGNGFQRRYIVKYQTALASVGGSHQANTESAACLLLALGISRGGGATALSTDQIGFAVGDTDADGIPELVDGWGNPVGFLRFPWNMPNPAAGTTKYADAVDPTGTLINPSWYRAGPLLSPNALAVQTAFGTGGTSYPLMTGTNATYTLPVIVSSGGAGVPALSPDLSVVIPNYIYSFNLTLN
jgi:prepilin-type N-terminal cleavage/methylation domain-containing protein